MGKQGEVRQWCREEVVPNAWHWDLGGCLSSEEVLDGIWMVGPSEEGPDLCLGRLRTQQGEEPDLRGSALTRSKQHHRGRGVLGGKLSQKPSFLAWKCQAASLCVTADTDSLTALCGC